MDALDREILAAIEGRTAGTPQNLAGILAWVDARQKTVLTHAELEGGLRRLFAAGVIAEAGPLRYYAPAASPAERIFSGVSVEEHREACEAYLKAFWDAGGEDEEDEFPRKKIAVRWAVAGDRYPSDEDQAAAEALLERLEPVLAGAGLGEIIGCELGPGSVDILVFGRDTDDDVDALYDLLAPAFRAFGCPAGSCIIRTYRDRGEERVSDLVGPA